jgi:hypothetical protein
MPLNLASPGILVREVDLTNGRIDPTTDKIGAIVAPFPKGPVNLPTLVSTEQQLVDIFGEPSAIDKHYEHWLTASSYLAYGGGLQVVRASGDNLTNALAGAASSITINSTEDYVTKTYDENTIGNVTIAARNPGSWANGIQVAIIDSFADQTLSGEFSDVLVGYGVTQGLDGKVLIGAGSTSSLDGYYLKGIVTEVGVGNSSVKVKVNSYIDPNGDEVEVDYTAGGTWQFAGSGTLGVHTNGYNSAYGTKTYDSASDWFDTQTVQISSTGISTVTYKWNALAGRPGTSAFAESRKSKNDEVHVIVFDGNGSITGTVGTVIEKHIGLSKATDAQFSAGSPSYWRKYLYNNSAVIFGGSAPAGITTTGFSSGFTLQGDDAWDQPAEDIIFSAAGNQTFTLSKGFNYDYSSGISTAGALDSTKADINGGYDILANTEEYDVDFLIQGSASYGKEAAQALASKLISVAESRKDAIAFISPYRGAFLSESADNTTNTINSADTITDNVVSFFAPLPSSSYAVFDSGYKYMYDRFANTFRYVPLNGDIAGICARNDINNFPWFSPAGTARGSVLNAIKLAYNPTKSQRDVLYSNRINPVIFSPGDGIILFGDKTGLARASAFDRINVRRLFLFLEDAISAAAKDQLFEFNDEITRTNFVNIVEPFLRDVQAKRGITDYVVVCDQTNNTAAVIDANEFVADIFIKPARSINFIGLTFVATRTGVSFEEVIGNV